MLQIQKFFTVVLFNLFVFSLLELLLIFFPELKEIIEDIPMVVGGASAVYFLFRAETYFSRFITLYNLLLSDLFLYLHHYPIYDVDVAIMLLLVISGAFFFSFAFHNDDSTFECTFLILIIGRFFIPDLFPYEITLVIALIFLFLFDRETLQKKKGVFFGLILIFFFFVICGSTGVIQIQEINFRMVLLLGIASASAIRFWCLAKTEDGQYLAFSIYVLTNCLLGVCLKEGETLPTVTIIFLVVNLLFILFLYVICIIKEEKMSTLLSEFKIMFCGIYFWALYRLNHAFFSLDLDLDRWIGTMTVQIFLLLFLIFLLETKRR